MRRERLIYLGLILATLAAYWPVAHFKLLYYDDWTYIIENPCVRQGFTLWSTMWAFQSVVLGNWHPITWLSLMLDVQLFGCKDAAFHLVNLLFHVLNTLLVFRLLRRMTAPMWTSAIAAALFALHPLHVESVAWVAERKDMLSTFFGLLSLLAYLRYAEKKAASGAGGRKAGSGDAPQASRPWRRDYILAMVFLLLGLMSKPMLVTWPCVMLLLDFWPLGRLSLGRSPGRMGAQGSQNRPPTPIRSLVYEKIPFFGLTVAICVITMVAQRLAGAMPASSQVSVSAMVDNALVSYLRYLGKVFWPHPLAAYYPYELDWPDWAVGGSVIVLALVTAGAVWQRNRRPYLRFGWLWFVGTLVPVIGLVQVGSQSMADRYMYIPSIGLFLALVWGARDLMAAWPERARRVVTVTAAVGVLGGCLAATLLQLRYWKDSESLFRHTLAVTSDNMLMEYGLGDTLLREGKFNEGMPHLRRALELNPNCIGARIKLADVSSRKGDFREAIEQYRQVLQLQPDLTLALNNLAWLLATCPDPELHDGAEAVQLAERACKQFQDDVPSSLDTLATAYASVGRFDDAVKTAEKAQKLAIAQRRKPLADRIARSIAFYRAGKTVPPRGR
jgi:hypothetical protein